MRALPLVVALLVPLTSFAQDTPCDEAKDALDVAEAAIRECLDVALGECEAEQEQLDAAQAAYEGCSGSVTEPPPPDPTDDAIPPGEPPEAEPASTPAGEPPDDAEPTSTPAGELPDAAPASIPTGEPPDAAPASTPAPAIEGTIALVIDGVSSDEQDVLSAAARLGLAGASLVDSGAVRAARAFLGSELDDASARTLRQELGADRLVVVQVKTVGSARFVSLRVFDASGASQHFAEASTATLPDVIRALLAEIPPASRPESAPEPDPFVSAPLPQPTPAWESLPREPPDSPGVTTVPYADIAVFGGNKSLDPSDWAPLASHVEAGLMATVGGSSWPIHLAGDYYYSYATGRVRGADLRVSTSELCAGLRRAFDLQSPMIRLHGGAGIGYVTVSNVADFDGSVATARGSSLGLWMGGGALLRIGSSISLGLQARYSVANPEIGDDAVSAGGLHIGATLGFGYGAADPSL